MARYQKTVDAAADKQKKTAESKAGADKDDACRCKEVSEKSPGELLKLMINDLAFWRKAKKGSFFKRDS